MGAWHMQALLSQPGDSAWCLFLGHLPVQEGVVFSVFLERNFDGRLVLSVSRRSTDQGAYVSVRSQTWDKG